jgi:hypothetical protein
MDQMVDVGLALPPAATELETSFSGTLLPTDAETIVPTAQDKAVLIDKEAASSMPTAKESVSAVNAATKTDAVAEKPVSEANTATKPDVVAEKPASIENATFKPDTVAEKTVSIENATFKPDAVAEKTVSIENMSFKSDSVNKESVSDANAAIRTDSVTEKSMPASKPSQSETGAKPATRALADHIAETMMKAAESSKAAESLPKEQSGQTPEGREKTKNQIMEVMVDVLETASAKAEAEEAKPPRDTRENPADDVAEHMIQDSLFGSDVAATEGASSKKRSRERDEKIQNEKEARTGASCKVDFKAISALWSEVSVANASSGGTDLQDSGGQISKLTALLSASNSALASLFQSFPDKAPDEFWTFWDQIRSLQARILEGMSDANQNQSRKQSLTDSQDAAQRTGGFIITPVARAGNAGQPSAFARFAGGNNHAGGQGAFQNGTGLGRHNA